jgi:hypothetical protein
MYKPFDKIFCLLTVVRKTGFTVTSLDAQHRMFDVLIYMSILMLILINRCYMPVAK